MDERETEAAANLQPCRAPQAISLYYLVHESKNYAAETKDRFSSAVAASIQECKLQMI